MIRYGLLILGILGASLVSRSTRAADTEITAKSFLGDWHTHSDGIGEGWRITEDKKSGKIKVIGEFRDEKTYAILGNFTGKDVDFKDGKLTFIQVYSKKPRQNWEDGVKMTIEIIEEKKSMKFTWETPSGKKGTRMLEPYVHKKVNEVSVANK
jgi:hypothetical protein